MSQLYVVLNESPSASVPSAEQESVSPISGVPKMLTEERTGAVLLIVVKAEAVPCISIRNRDVHLIVSLAEVLLGFN